MQLIRKRFRNAHQQQLGVAEDRIEWRTQLVRDHREEVGLGLVRQHGLFVQAGVVKGECCTSCDLLCERHVCLHVGGRIPAADQCDDTENVATCEKWYQDGRGYARSTQQRQVSACSFLRRGFLEVRQQLCVLRGSYAP